MSPWEAAITVADAAILGIAIPWLFIRMLAPSLAEGPTVQNYRGRAVFAGLGVVWLVWAGTATIGGLLGAASDGQQSLLPVLTLAGPLALVCFALGLIDDAYGTSAARGFRGHLSALRGGRLTTGGLKLLGISAASYVVALILAQAAGISGEAFVWALLSGASIALTANFVNLTDVRPGRALKTYVFLALIGVISCVLGLGAVSAPGTLQTWTDAIALVAFIVGPVVATWRLDLGERGMMGDAGANAAGAVAGMLIVSGLPWWGVVVYTVLLLAANLASEKVSFSRVVEGNALLRSIDRLGRSE